MEIKILLIGFNRLDQIKVVLEAIKNLPNSSKFVFIDGPRNDDDKLIQRDMVEWFLNCGIDKSQIIRPDRNLGINHSIPFAIDYVFNQDNANQILILEDDCVPSLEAIDLISQPLVQKCLDNGIVSLTNYFDYLTNRVNRGCITPIKIPTIWGWVVKKEVWKRIDIFKTYKNLPNIKDLLRGTNIIFNFFFVIKLLITKRFHHKLNKSWGTWDNYLGLSCRKEHIDCFVLPINGVSNIGYIGTNTAGSISNRNFDRRRASLASQKQNLAISNGFIKIVYSSLLSITYFMWPTFKLMLFYVKSLFSIEKMKNKNYL